MRIKLLVASLALATTLAVPTPANAQTQPLTPGEIPVDTGESESFRGLLQPKTAALQFNVRRSFSSRVEEQKPATFTIITAGKGKNTYAVDVAGGIYLRRGDRLQIAPAAIEWHRQSVGQPRNKVSAGASFDSRISPDESPLTVAARGEGNIIRNVLKDVTTGKASAFFVLFRPDTDGTAGGRLATGANRSVIRTQSNAIKGTWYLYAGAEWLHNQPFGDFKKKNASLATARLETKFYPFNHSATKIDSPWEISLSYSHRRPFSTEGLRSSYGLFAGEANVFVDRAHHVAVGFEYKNGTDPEDDFTSGHTGVLALRFKL